MANLTSVTCVLPRNYWVFGICPSSGILKSTEHNVSETVSVSVLRWGRKTPTLLGPLERANLNHWTYTAGHYLLIVSVPLVWVPAIYSYNNSKCGTEATKRILMDEPPPHLARALSFPLHRTSIHPPPPVYLFCSHVWKLIVVPALN
jgi:hypothetical protein